MPSFTFVSTANAFALRGAQPVFADVRPDTLNLDERALDDARHASARARSCPSHYAGVGCEMDAICAIAGARRRGRHRGQRARALRHATAAGRSARFGALATQSFHETKNVTCGEGGALIVNDAALVERAEIAAREGHEPQPVLPRPGRQVHAGSTLGSSYVPSDLLAAFLFAQLEARERIQAARAARSGSATTQRARAPGPPSTASRLPFVPEHCEQRFHMFYVLLPDARARARG